MKIINRGILKAFARRNPAQAESVRTWFHMMEAQNWMTLQDALQVFQKHNS